MNLPRPFLLDIDKQLNFCFVGTSLDAIGSANFLSRNELVFVPESERKIPMTEFNSAFTRQAVNYIFHTAFCGSTLLSRALHAPPAAVSLKEPRVLFQLSEASISLGDNVLSPHLQNALSELTQPWHDGGRVLIKPTNSCNRLASLILSADYDDRVVFMYSSLEEFLISCLKKMPEAEKRVNWMARHLLPGSRLEARCQVPRRDFNLIEACVLSWAASLEYFSQAIRLNPRLNFQTQAYKDLKHDTIETVQSLGRHFQLHETQLNPDAIRFKLAGNSKKTDMRFDSELNALHVSEIRSTYGTIIRDGLKWAEQDIVPFAEINPIFLK